MTDLVSLLPWLSDLAESFLGGAEDGGLTLDAELCRTFAEGIHDVIDTIQFLTDVLEQRGQLERVTLPLPSDRPRTPVERRRLAATAAPLDPERRILAFPVIATRAVAIAEGGSAA